MTPEERQFLRTLLSARVLGLGVLVENEPYVSLAPFAPRPDLSGLLIHASRLARHTAGLAPGAPFSALLSVADHPDANPLALPRLTLEGHVEALDKDTDAYEEAAEIYRARLPSSEVTFQLADFRLYELVPEDGQLIAGFGRVIPVGPEELREVAGATEE